MKAYLIPYKPDRSLGFGDKEGYVIKGPILYVPNKGTIFYELTVRGDELVHSIVPAMVDFVDDSKTLLGQIERQVKGESLEYYEGPNFDLSQGLIEVDVPEEEFIKIVNDARISSLSRDNYTKASIGLIWNVAKKISLEKMVVE